MQASEFVAKAIKDKAFLVEVCKHIPEEYLQEEGINQDDLGALMDHYFYDAATGMGYEFDADEFKAECDRQINGLSIFKKTRLILRFFKSLRKAGKGK